MGCEYRVRGDVRRKRKNDSFVRREVGICVAFVLRRTGVCGWSSLSYPVKNKVTGYLHALESSKDRYPPPCPLREKDGVVLIFMSLFLLDSSTYFCRDSRSWNYRHRHGAQSVHRSTAAALGRAAEEGRTVI